jgi:predicted amidohydrolase
MSYDIYTAVAIQNEVKVVSERSDIDRNLSRVLDLIDSAPQLCYTAKGNYQGSWAPIKLISFSEFFIQGHEGTWPYRHYLDNVLITLPGAESEKLAQKAKEYGIYIAGCVLERDPEWEADGYFFNTHFIMAPSGEIIHKYRKITTATHYELSCSPHDMYSRWVERFGDSLSSFMPVTQTDIGRLGTITCMDGHFPETARALGVQGAEVILHPLLIDPMMSPPSETWQMMNRMRAWENVCYVVAASWGALLGAKRPKMTAPGKSMICDYTGAVIAYADFPGEAIISATINLEELRRRRLDPTRNFPVLLRNEVYRKIYEETLYPPDQFSDKNPQSRVARDPHETIRRFVREGRYVLPDKLPEGFEK